MIHDALDVTTGIMSYWFKDQPFTPNDETIERIKSCPFEPGALRHNNC
jgi:hypothetical protein